MDTEIKIIPDTQDVSKSQPKCKGSVCWPLIVYIILTITALIAVLAVPNLDGGSKATTFIICLVWSLFWGFILWWLCRYCHWVWAWILLFVPFIINILFFIIVLLAVGAFDIAGSFPSSVTIASTND